MYIPCTKSRLFNTFRRKKVPVPRNENLTLVSNKTFSLIQLSSWANDGPQHEVQL